MASIMARYGSPRMHAALRAEGGTARRGRVARLMRRHGIRALAGRRFRQRTSRLPPPSADRAEPAEPGIRRTGTPMESSFHTLKVELVHQRKWATREEARRGPFAYIEGYYNRRRIHAALGYRTPEQAELQMA
jgi:transposase InsO family protein